MKTWNTPTTPHPNPPTAPPPTIYNKNGDFITPPPKKLSKINFVIPEANLVIAEACGWIKFWQPDNEQHESTGHWEWRRGDDTIRRLPDYCRDLNACADMEKCLKQQERGEYMDRISEISGLSGDMGWGCQTATAAERCEAFLKTIGKWDGKI